jgi:hypothetical protein
MIQHELERLRRHRNDNADVAGGVLVVQKCSLRISVLRAAKPYGIEKLREEFDRMANLARHLPAQRFVDDSARSKGPLIAVDNHDALGHRRFRRMRGRIQQEGSKDGSDADS